MKKSYSGRRPASRDVRVGGQRQVGQGRMTITESQPSERVALKLEFIKPFQSTNVTTFVLAPEETAPR